MEEPIKFINRNKEYLFGMLFIPDNQVRRRIGIVISVSAIKYRIGTNRFHTILARHLCSLGYHVFYFDPSGIGDSEGIFEEKPLREHGIEIQVGKYIQDTRDALNYFLSRFELNNTVVLGLCGGAVSMLLTAGEDFRVNGVVLLAMPILLSPAEEQGAAKEEVASITSEIMAGRKMVKMAGKLGDLEVWKKIVTFQVAWKSELKVMWRALSVIVWKGIEKINKNFFGYTNAELCDTPVSSHPRFNFLLQKAFGAVVKRGNPILLIFADQDFVTWQFKSEFQDTALYPGNPYEGHYEIHVVENANHVFSGDASQEKVIKIICCWLRNRFPVNQQCENSQ